MSEKFATSWLNTLCGAIPGIHSAVLMMSDSENNLMRPLAIWPATLETHKDFLDVVKYALKKQKPLCLPNSQSIEGQAHDFLALPFFVAEGIPGVIVIKVEHLPEEKHKPALNYLKKSVKWLRIGGASKAQDDDFYSSVVGLLAASFEQGSYHQGLIRLVGELTRQFDCERVALSEYQHHRSHVLSLSNSASFDQRSTLIQNIARAMDEAIDQDQTIVFPNSQSSVIQRAHQELARKVGSGSLCTIPLTYEQKVFGAVTLLNNEEKPFDARAVNLCQQTLSLMTPFLALKRDNEKGLLDKLGKSIIGSLHNLFGLKFLKLKLLTTVVSLMLVLGSLVESDFRVSADAILEGKIQRVVAAPVSGYLLSASVRAGDTVSKGDIMASLNDTDLQLELAKLNGQLQKSRREYRQALSTRDLVKVSLVKEQINQNNAEIELNHHQLSQIKLSAPFDGIVIEGDLSQLLGSPVERGDSLFTVAPLDGYRIILKVDESDIAHVKTGQTGTLALSSLAEHQFDLTVEKITAIARAGDGANIFRVEASLANPPELLRPGMQGVGKINIGRSSLIWIWTHEITDWVRLWVWSWWP